MNKQGQVLRPIMIDWRIIMRDGGNIFENRRNTPQAEQPVADRGFQYHGRRFYGIADFIILAQLGTDDPAKHFLQRKSANKRIFGSGSVFIGLEGKHVRKIAAGICLAQQVIQQAGFAVF